MPNNVLLLNSVKPKSNRRTFLLDKRKNRIAAFSILGAEIVCSATGVQASLHQASKDSLWISYDKALTDALLRSLRGPKQLLGQAMLIHPFDPQSLAALSSCFQRFAFDSNNGFLPPEELAEVLRSENYMDLFVGGSLDQNNKTMTLWRGDLEPLTVPFSAFETSGDGTRPDFSRFSVTDFGQTIRLGDYEAATDAILYEFDPRYRRRLTKERRLSERSFGASVRRLRKQRGLRREDFVPDLTSKTIARIEQGDVRRVRSKTLQALARHLQVKPEEIETY